VSISRRYRRRRPASGSGRAAQTGRRPPADSGSLVADRDDALAGASISPFPAVTTSSLKSLSAHATARLNARLRQVTTFSSAAMTDARPESPFKLGAMEYRSK
jgi:hypothetical protein